MLSIVVPTYKEAENLEPLVRRIDATLSRAAIDYEVIIADDNSPDDTPAVCDRLKADYPVTLVLPEGRERDLSLSVVDGIDAASFGRILVMDADLSHPPERIPDMMACLDRYGSAFVIGSRYAEGGSFDRDWSLWRFLNSYAATLLARPLTRCSDPMSGFFMFDIKHIGDISSLRPVGYKIGLELMVRGGFDRIIEVPIAFSDREIGASKMDLRQQFNYLRHLRRLYLFRYGGFAEFIHFGAVGLSGFFVDIFFYYLLQTVGISHQISRGLSFWPAASWNWAVNRRTTFGERQRRPRARQWAEFLGTSLVGFTINWSVYLTLTATSVFFDHYRILAIIVGILCAYGFNFTLSTLFVYSEKRK